MERTGRYEILDAARGLSIILMVGYHFLFDLVAFAGFPDWVVYNPVLSALLVFFGGLFIFISGISARLSANNVRRGLKFLLLALAVTAVTRFMNPDAYVRFGILHLLGAAALLYAAGHSFFERIRIHPLLWLLAFFAVRALLARPFPVPYLWPFGVYTSDFFSADYYPIFPWILVYLLGAQIGGQVKAGGMPDWFYRFKAPFFAAAGRHTLIIYLVHQPVLYPLSLLIARLVSGSFD